MFPPDTGKCVENCVAGCGLRVAGRGVDLGLYGPTYQIAERDIRELFIEGLREVFSERNRRLAVMRLKERIENFDLHIPEAKAERTWKVDTTFKLERDIMDHEGNVIARAGTYNIFDFILPVERTYVFIDGRKETHIEFARKLKENGHVKVILTAGNVLEVKKKGFPEVYQASEGLLERFGIKAVPATAEVKGREITAKEVAF